MKKFAKILCAFTLICFWAVMLSSVSMAKEELDLQLKKKADSIVLQWNGSKKETYSVYKKAGNGKFKAISKAKGKKYTDKALKGGESYTYYIKKSKRIKSDYESLTYLPSPKMKSAQVSNSGITIRWKSAEGAEAYAVYRKENGGKNILIGKAEGESFFDNKAVKGVVYTYTVKSLKGKSKSVASTRKVGVLKAPELVSLERSAEGLVLNWKKVEGAQAYAVYRKDFDGAKWKKLASVKSYELSYEDITAIDEEKYSYFVKAKEGDSSSLNEGKYMSELCIKAPAGFTLRKDGKKMKLSWDKKEDAVSYEIYRKVKDGKWKKIKETTATAYTDTVKNAKKLLSYKVLAVTKDGKSGFSAVRTNRQVDPSKPMVALTYDDGPHPINTHRILDVLEKHGARATFFVVGSRITEYKDCLVRQNKLGCEVANHSYSHVSLGYNSNETILEEVRKTDKLIEKYTGQTDILIRAPGGSVGKGPKLTGRPFIQWSVDTLDWKTLSSSYVVNHIKKTVRDGSIILMHDLYGSTAAASEIIIPWLISRGYQLVTVSEMLEARGIEAKGGRVYYNAYA